MTGSGIYWISEHRLCEYCDVFNKCGNMKTPAFVCVVKQAWTVLLGMMQDSLSALLLLKVRPTI